MKRYHLISIMILCLTLLCMLPVQAGDITPGYLYRSEENPDIPDILYVGWTKDCGNYRIKLLQDPVLNKSTNYMVADADTVYLTLRVALTNLGGETGGWFAPDTFRLQDTYHNRIYGTYSLDLAISAKTAEGFKQDVFFSEIKPGETLYTSLVFAVYPDVQSWILIFSPRTFFEEAAAETVSFRLPRAVEQE